MAVIILVLIAAASIIGTIRKSQGREVSHVNLPPGTVANPKMQWMQDQKRKAQGQPVAPPAANGEMSPSDMVNPAASKH